MAITRINVATASGSAVSSLNALLSSGAVTAGNTLICHATVGFDSVQSTLVPTDNINAGAWSTALYATSTSVGALVGSAGLFYRVNISSGAIASTYRVRFDAFGIADDPAMIVYEYSGIASFDKAANAAGNSSSPAAASQSAASVSALFSGFAATANSSTNTFRSTGAPTNMTVVSLLRNGGAGPNFASGELITSSLTEQLIFRIAASSNWVAQTAIFLASTGGGAATLAFRDALPMLGCV